MSLIYVTLGMQTLITKELPIAARIFCRLFYSYYGLTVWFPDMIRYFQDEAYKSKMKVFLGEHVYGASINFTMENQIHQRGKLVNDK